MKVHGYLAGAVIALAACAGGEEAAAPLTVSDVAVSSDLSAVTSRDAARYWGNMESDLESAIAAEFVGQTGPGGVNIEVDIDEISLANFFQSQAGADNARLTGSVAVIDAQNEQQRGFYTVSASANEVATFLPPDSDVVTVSRTSAEFYSAVVQAFARGVADAVRTGAATQG
jgi:hypothetical protein